MLSLGSKRLTALLPLLAVLTATTLFVSQGLAWVFVDRAAQAATRGEAEALLELFADYLVSLGRRADQRDVAAFVARHRAAGLYYAAILPPAGVTGAVEAGRALLPEVPADQTLIAEGARVRAVRLPPRRRHARRLAQGSRLPPVVRDTLASSEPAEPREARPPFPPLTVEFEARLAPELRTDALRTLLGSALSSTLFVLLALGLRQAVRQREAALRSAEQDRHLAALGEMSSVVAHELRNPLASLKGHAQLLVKALPEGGAARAKAERVVSEALRLEQLSASLLEFVRSGELQHADVDIGELVRAAADAVDGTRFTLALPRERVTAWVDGPRLHQVLVNVLMNACQASQDGAAARIEVSVTRVHERVEIRVRDHGPGITPGDEERIFLPFQTSRARGTGLGLTIARRIVQRHRGIIVARNHPAGGAEIVIDLPREGMEPV